MNKHLLFLLLIIGAIYDNATLNEVSSRSHAFLGEPSGDCFS